MIGTPKSVIFVVDDDEAVRDSLRTLLEISDFDVAAFDSCQAFLDRYDGTRDGCLVLDMHMPDMTGLELLEVMAARGMAIAIVIITGRSDPAVRARALSLGAMAVLDKPVQPVDLFAVLDRALGRLD
jgi:two-component system response regulator FixJ